MNKELTKEEIAEILYKAMVTIPTWKDAIYEDEKRCLAQAGAIMPIIEAQVKAEREYWLAKIDEENQDLIKVVKLGPDL